MLAVEGLVKAYGGIRPVGGLSFEIGEHETVGLLGQNGAGKSTTMRMLAGALAPTSGRISLCGVDSAVKPSAYRRMIGYLPEVPPLYPDMTVREQLRFACALRGVKGRARAAAIDGALRRLSLSDVSGRLIGHLSKGYRQRVGLAAALMGENRLLILDEPSAGLDPAQAADLRDLIRALSGEMSILISSHILSEISYVCSRVLIMRGGLIVLSGTLNEIRARCGQNAALCLTVAGDGALAERVVRTCVGTRAAVTLERAVEGTRFRVAGDAAAGLEAELFQAVAREREKLSIVRMAQDAPSLEEIFLLATCGQGEGGNAQ